MTGGTVFLNLLVRCLGNLEAFDARQLPSVIQLLDKYLAVWSYSFSLYFPAAQIWS
ncbi:hypothetical protein COCC4DRAFT_32086 [Bipolaris maydis ATCC 48331]|uniref:Uncharacterized protein n=2 Tax=Cochliobolus heterostrophus TaxID=5016 RepID=M2STD2_COCH5|nr:uncharacterized protein COCC4DRAFT_32086 [Bipolaris maydis ATCC 48331]EMD88620.1 hypothetical protein COCHEDRAFT_1022941 [Bipolaris maydis C5]ENI05664.1 hypothetical protein COCC4DRAFT_32086 [Bipolaris maydis ATCC 48331]